MLDRPDQYPHYQINSSINNLRKASVFLNKEFNENKANENLNIKNNEKDIISMTPRNISQTNEALLGAKNKPKSPTKKKKLIRLIKKMEYQ